MDDAEAVGVLDIVPTAKGKDVGRQLGRCIYWDVYQRMGRNQESREGWQEVSVITSFELGSVDLFSNKSIKSA